MKKVAAMILAAMFAAVSFSTFAQDKGKSADKKDDKATAAKKGDGKTK